jgi:hypothetical protein
MKMIVESKGGPFPDAAGCIGSYPLGEGPNEITLPPQGYFYRISRRKLKIYNDFNEIDDHEHNSLKEIPNNHERVIVRACHNGRTSYYNMSWF